jgi:F-type H+-transporting ATPase subunit b
MKRSALAAVLLLALSSTGGIVLAQEAAEKKDEEHASDPASGEHGGMEMWKWANFAVLAAGLAYLIGKNAGPFFASRSRQIRKDMLEAADARKDAEARAAEVDRRLSNLEAEIATLRADAQREAESERQRLSAASVAEVEKIRVHAEQEIASAGKAARSELKRYSAELAIGLAEQKIRARMTPDSQDALVSGFVRDLDRPSSRAQSI